MALFVPCITHFNQQHVYQEERQRFRPPLVMIHRGLHLIACGVAVPTRLQVRGGFSFRSDLLLLALVAPAGTRIIIKNKKQLLLRGLRRQARYVLPDGHGLPKYARIRVYLQYHNTLHIIVLHTEIGCSGLLYPQQLTKITLFEQHPPASKRKTATTK